MMPENNSYHRKSKKQILISILLIIFVLLIGLILSKYLIKSKKKPQRKFVKDLVINVDVLKGKRVNTNYRIEGFGKFYPYKSVSIVPEVSGKIVAVNKQFIEGGFIKKGDIIVEIDNRDYILNLKMLQKELDVLNEDLKIELAKHKAAILELNATKSILEVNDDLSIYILKRIPYVKKLKANIEITKLKIKQAKLNIQRAKIKAPFDLYVTSKYLDYGSFVQKGQKIADCISANKVYIKGSMEKSKISYIDGLDNVVVKFKLYNDEIVGKLYKIERVLDKSSLLANVILELNYFPRLAFINDYVKFYIVGKELKNIIKLPVYVLRGDSSVWLVKDKKIHIKKIDVIYKDEKYIYTYDLNEHDEVVVTNLQGVTEGTKVKIVKTVDIENG